MIHSLCQACQLEPVTQWIVSDDPGYPYKLCDACVHRLENYALRPREWYNLACLFGPFSFHLHDDFYDDDGTACQPKIPVEEPEKYPAPTFTEVQYDLDALLDHALTRWHLEESIISALQGIEPDVLLQRFQQLVVERPSQEIICSVYTLAAKSLGSRAADWMRSSWETASSELLYTLAHVASCCLPADEAYARVLEVLDLSSEDIAAKALYLLSDFRSKKTLIWITKHVPAQVTENWGILAAVSQFDWPTAHEWILAGRPLSLIALDALNAMHQGKKSKMLERMSPNLRLPPLKEDLIRTLEAYRDNDSAPRVRKAVELAIENVDAIVLGKRKGNL